MRLDYRGRVFAVLTIAIAVCAMMHLLYHPMDPLAHVDSITSQLDDIVGVLLRPYSPEEGVIFLKTHKTGGSTVSSVIWHNLCEKRVPLVNRLQPLKRCFLPPREHPGKTWDLGKQMDMELARKPNQSVATSSFYDVWVHHAVFNKALFHLVPTTNRIISIVRRPAQRFQSAWHWYNHSARLGLANLSDFVVGIAHGSRIPKFKYRSGLDATTEELTGVVGFRSSSWLQQSLAFQDLVDRIVSRRLILLVTERFDESMLVLGSLMGWNQIDRLVYFRHKTASYAHATHETLNALDQLQPYDLALWKLANKMLDRALRDIFANQTVVKGQLTRLRKENLRIESACRHANENVSAVPCDCLRKRDNNLVVTEFWTNINSSCVI